MLGTVLGLWTIPLVVENQIQECEMKWNLSLNVGKCFGRTFANACCGGVKPSQIDLKTLHQGGLGLMAEAAFSVQEHLHIQRGVCSSYGQMSLS